jgi:hypothetical protein
VAAITAVSAVVIVVSGEPKEKLERTLSKTMAACPVGQLYEKAGVPVKTRLVVQEA